MGKYRFNEKFSRMFDNFSENEKSLILSKFVLTHIKKGTRIETEGELNSSILFLCEGIVMRQKLYNNKPLIVWFDFSGEFMSDSKNLIYRSIAYTTAIAMTDITVYSLAIEQNKVLLEVLPDWNNFMNAIVINKLTKYIDRFLLLRNSTATSMYLDLIEDYPNLIKVVPSKYIASYLDVKIETLSRIRAKQGR